MIPLAIPNIGKLEGEYLKACIDENFVSSVGRFVTRFEDEVASISGTEHAAATGSGTQALHLALRALNVGPGDLVILPSFTFIGSANAISHCGAIPWLMDIEPKSWTLDPKCVAHALAKKTERQNGELIHTPSGRKVKAIMPVYTVGNIADMDAIGDIASKYGLKIVADAAAAIGAFYHGSPIGTIADLTAYSFNGNKTITSGGGGAVVGPNSALVKRVKHLSSTARVSQEYDHDEVGFNYRMTNLEAAVGCAQLQRLKEFIEAKRRIRIRYNKLADKLAWVQPFPQPCGRDGVSWFSGFVIKDARLPKVSEICSRLKDQKIEARGFWKPVHMQLPYSETPREVLDVTEGLWSHIITLPCSTSLTDDDQQRVIDVLEPMLTIDAF